MSKTINIYTKGALHSDVYAFPLVGDIGALFQDSKRNHEIKLRPEIQQWCDEYLSDRYRCIVAKMPDKEICIDGDPYYKAGDVITVHHHYTPNIEVVNNWYINSVDNMLVMNSDSFGTFPAIAFEDDQAMLHFKLRWL